MMRSQRFRWMALVVALLLFLPTGLVASAASAPDKDIVIAFNNDIQALDPHNASDTLALTVSNAQYEGLLQFNDEQQLIPQLATDWVIGDDNLTYTFHLRQGVKFHDGSDFNAAAFVANYERVQANPNLRQYRRTNTWDSVTTPDEYTVVIKLKAPHSSFLNQFTQFKVISPAAIESLGTEGLAKNSCGTGAFQLSERLEGDHTTLVPFAGYWAAVPAIDSLTFLAVPEDGSRVAMLRTGEADYIYPMPPIQAAVVDGLDDIVVKTGTSNIMRYVTLNTNVPQLSDKLVRQALNYAIDKQAYIKTVFNGFASEVLSCYPSSVSYYAPQTPYDIDLEKAKALLAEAGYPDGFEITMWGDNTTVEELGMQFVQQQLAQIGVKLDVQAMDPNIQSDLRNVPEEDATINTWYVNWSSSSFDADGSMRAILYGDQIPPTSANTAYWRNDEFDSLLDEARLTSDPAQLTDLYAKIQSIVWDEAPWLFLGSDQVISGQKTYVDGISLRPDGSVDVKNIQVD
ncbi:glutathione ABC transporter substrate-binding protein GsiB [Clostridia bacterium]|nr:glutathione ABC transporter substrate-binding protein GsiB [Clostridia bacterium]